MRSPCAAFLFFALCLLSACGSAPVCPPQTTTAQAAMLATASPGPAAAPAVIEIGGRPISFDRVVDGPLCDDVWSGTVYVGCNVQVNPWVDQPTFLEECDLTIAPGSVVYVAYHNNEPYYNGCSCHTDTSVIP